MISLFGKAKRPSPLYKRRGTGADRHSVSCFSSKTFATSSYPEKAAIRPWSLRRRQRRRLLSRLRHGPEERQGEGEGRVVRRGAAARGASEGAGDVSPSARRAGAEKQIPPLLADGDASASAHAISSRHCP